MIEIGLAAGFIKNQKHLEESELLKSAADFITFGSFTEDAHTGNPEPREKEYMDGKAYVNAINLENPGVRAAMGFMDELQTQMDAVGKRVRISLAPTRPGSLRTMLFQTAVMPDRLKIEQEYNLACPNHREGGKLHEILAHSPRAVRDVLEETRGFAIDATAVKIAPDTKPEVLAKICELCVEFRITKIVSGNTRKIKVPVVDGQPLLHKSIKYCGLSGEPLVESGMKQVATLRQIITDRGYNLKIDACGGISTGAIFKGYLDSGADGAQLGTAYTIRTKSKARIFSDIYEEYASLI